MKLKIYPNSKAQRMVEALFMLTVLPITSMVENDTLPAESIIFYLGFFLLLTAFNSIAGNLIRKYEGR